MGGERWRNRWAERSSLGNDVHRQCIVLDHSEHLVGCLVAICMHSGQAAGAGAYMGVYWCILDVVEGFLMGTMIVVLHTLPYWFLSLILWVKGGMAVPSIEVTIYLPGAQTSEMVTWKYLLVR